MITINRLRLRARHALLLWQAQRLLARANRRQALRAAGLNPRAGYDELASVPFISVMVLAVVVLLVDVGDHWPAVTEVVNAFTALVVGA